MAQASNSSSQLLTSHIPRLSKPKSIVKIVKSLQSLPRELVHQVLDDVPVLKILLLAASETATTSNYIDECILGHPDLRQLFRSKENFSAIRDLFIVLYSLRASLSLAQAPSTSPLALNFGILVTNGERMAPGLRWYLRRELYEILYSVHDERLHALHEVLNIPPDAKPVPFGLGDTQDCQSLLNRWQWHLAAQERMNGLRAAQLHKMADMYNAFPFVWRTAS